MKCYKLTDSNGYTRWGCYNATLWGNGVTHTAKGNGGLCSNGVIHAYASPELALLMNPIHGDFKNPLFWECEGTELVKDDGTKQGYRTLTTIERIEYIKPTVSQCVRFAILCAKQVYEDVVWNQWADRWLDGTDRTAETIKALYTYITYETARYALGSAYYAYYYYYSIHSDNNAYDTISYDSACSAESAVDAAHADDRKRINLLEIAKRAMEED